VVVRRLFGGFRRFLGVLSVFGPFPHFFSFSRSVFFYFGVFTGAPFVGFFDFLPSSDLVP
jgi:hypothetical protein